jgi:transposase
MQNEPTPRRRRFDGAFKQDAVRVLLQGDQPLKPLATDLGVSHRNLRDWQRRYGPADPVRSAEAWRSNGVPSAVKTSACAPRGTF